MHEVHIELSFVYPSIRDRRAVGLIWATWRWHSHDAEYVRGFRVGLRNLVADGHSVQAALGEPV
jgi:hypothetical protein